MRKISLLLCCILLVMTGCSTGSVSGIDDKSSGALINEGLNYMDVDMLWEEVMQVYLNDALWIERDIYDAGHNLMVPIHAAFKKGNEVWISDINQHFESFIDNYNIENKIVLLNKLHYYYAASRYLSLLVEYDHPLKEHHYQLADMLKDEVTKQWLEENSWHWSHDGFIGMKERLNYKLGLTEPRFSFDRAIIDEELFLVSIASDLKYFYQKINQNHPVLKDINEYGQKIFIDEGQLVDEGGWLFQKNVWKDHRDFSYSGYESIEEIKDGKRKVRDFIYIDSSHGTRFPLQIYSVMKATDELEQKELLQTIRKNFEIQFWDKIVTKKEESNYFVINNFLDGSNGVYRYDYETNKGTGYGPHSLSGILMIGWYNFLNTERVSDIYEEIAMQFPISEEVYSKYYLDKTNRVRNPLAKEPDAYYKGLYQLILLLSSEPLLKE